MNTSNCVELLNFSQLKQKLDNLTSCYNLKSITADSRKVTSNSIFVALKGLTVDARTFIPQVVKNGCKVIITYLTDEEKHSYNGSEREDNIAVCIKTDATSYVLSDQESNKELYIIKVHNIENCLSLICLGFYDNLLCSSDSSKNESPTPLDLPVIGITGTNGKTMTANLICQLLSKYYQSQVNYIGTIGLGNFSNLRKAVNSTPEACTVMNEIYQAQVEKACAMVMEVTSHALKLNRAKSVRYEQALFTNLTQDHLDFHKTIEDYFLAKSLFFITHNVKDFIITCDSDLNDFGDILTSMVAIKLGRNSDNGVRNDFATSSFNNTEVNENLAFCTLKHNINSFNNSSNSNEINTVGINSTYLTNYQEKAIELLNTFSVTDFEYVLSDNSALQHDLDSRIAVIFLSSNFLQETYDKADIVLILNKLTASPSGLQLSFNFVDKIKNINEVIHIQSNLFGIFNGYNLLSAFLSLYLHGVPLNFIIQNISDLENVNGRMQSVKNDQGKVVLVDFAHTPDALEKAITSAKEHFNSCNNKTYVVFGCGGDRDPLKRPIMGSIASRLADYVIVTDDNPRSEDPQGIAAEILNGCHDVSGGAESIYINDRSLALKHVIEVSKENDLILVCGKGHETTQIFADRVEYFSDFEELIKIFNS